MVQHKILHFLEINQEIKNTQLLDQAALKITQVHCSFLAFNMMTYLPNSYPFTEFKTHEIPHQTQVLKLVLCSQSELAKKEEENPPDTCLLSLASDLEPEEAVNTTALGNKSLARPGKAFVC